MAKIKTIILRCLSPTAQIEFYCKVLGMTSFDDGSIGYIGPNARIQFVQAKKQYQACPDNLYWKIALAVPNIELAFDQLSKRDLPISVPHQFQDIGYMAHLTDPEGFTIELIEHTFKGQRSKTVFDRNTLGGGAHLNLLTLRVGNILNFEPALLAIGLRPLSIQQVEPDRFSLYFYAFTNDDPPSKDLKSVTNRPWLYQRPYTILELQDYNKPISIIPPNIDEAGYAKTIISGCDDRVLSEASLECLRPLHLQFERTPI